MKRSPLLTSGFCITALLLAGCGKDDPVLARIGDVDIRASAYQRFVERLPASLQSDQEGRAGDLEHLQSMVDRELLFREARAKGIDSSAAVKGQVERLARNRLVNTYQVRVVAPRVKVEAAQVERAFLDRGFDRERLLSRIVVESPEERDQVLSELREGRAFAELAQRFADNDPAAGEDGVVGWIGLPHLDWYKVPRAAFFSLSKGQVARPVRLPGAWQIYRFAEDRKSELTDYSEGIHRLLESEAWQAELEREFELLTQRYGLRLHAEGLERLRQGPIRNIVLAPDEASQTLYSFSEGEVALRECLTDLKEAGVSGELPGGQQGVDLLEDLVVRSRLLAVAARAKGWEREPEFAEWLTRKREWLILRTLVRAQPALQEPISEAESRAYYQANANKFRSPAEVEIREALMATEAQAQALREEIEQGVEMSALLNRPGVGSHAGPGSKGKMILRPLFRSRYPQLVAAAFAAEEGELVGPVETHDGFAVFRVLGRKGGQILPFERVRKRAEALLRQRREQEGIVELIGALRAKGETQVVFFTDRLQ